MSKIFTAALVAVFAAIGFAWVSNDARADHFYVSLSSGGDQREIEDVIGTASINDLQVRAAVGYYFTDEFHGAVQYTYVPHRDPVYGVERDDSLFLMGYYDFEPVMGATPFIGGGIGWEVSGVEFGSGMGQVEGGLAYPVSDNVDLTATYSYRFDIHMDEVGQGVFLGARWHF